MRLTEAEGKALLTTAGLRVPQGVVVTSLEQLKELSAATEHPFLQHFPLYTKAQVLYGNRALQGLVLKANSLLELLSQAEKLFDTLDVNGRPISTVLVEEAIAFEAQAYVSLSYDTQTRQPVFKYSAQAGEGIEERVESIASQPFSVLQGPSALAPNESLTEVLEQLWSLFISNDAILLEINPLVKTAHGWYCLDAKIELDEVAHFRHENWSQYGERSTLGRPWTEREEKAHQISHTDHRGVAGESFFEFHGGEIGVMASGGGASTLLMDTLMAEGLKPANYTEYSGNPVREKVHQLTKVVTSIPNLKALLVAGSNANFTDIYETLGGVIDGFLESDYADTQDFCLIIRRGGPRWEEAFTMVQERLASKPIKLRLFGPEFPLVKTISELQKLLAEKS